MAAPAKHTPTALRVETALAQDFAAGVPVPLLCSKFGLGVRELEARLEEPAMAALIEEKKAELQTAAAVSLAKLTAAGPRIVDNVITMASDLDHPECTRNAHYILDRLLPKQPVQIEMKHRFDEGTAREFSEAFRALQGIARLDDTIEVFDIESDPHLRNGTEVMNERDAAGAAKLPARVGDAAGDGEADGRESRGSL